MRIAFISPFLFRYRRGLERLTTNMAERLSSKDCSVVVISWDGPIKNKMDYNNRFQIVKIPYSRYFQAYLASLYYLLFFFFNKFDFINVFFTWHGENIPLYILYLLKKQKFNIILPNPLSQIPHRIEQYKKFNLHKKAKTIIAQSNFYKRETEGIFNRVVQYIPNGVETQFFKPDEKRKEELREQLGINKEKCLFLTVSAFEERKGIREFIKAISLVKGIKDKLEYFVIGEIDDKNYYEEIKNLIISEGLTDIVKIYLPVEDILSFYQLTDCFVLLSTGEGSPNALLEAMSCGLPVLASKEPPFDESINEEFGFLLDKKNVKEISEAIFTLSSNKELRIEMGEKARNHAINNFSLEKITVRYIQLFSSE